MLLIVWYNFNRQPERGVTMNPFEARLNRAKRKLEKLEAQQRQLDASTIPGSYVTGASGQSAAYRKRLDRQLERTVNLATALVQARRDVAHWQSKADAYDAGLINAQGRAKPVSAEVQRSDRQRERAERKSMTPEERLFMGNFPAGIVYADRGRTKHSDYARVAFLSYRTLVLEWDDDAHKSPQELRALVEADAASIQARRGERYDIAQSCVILGG